MASVVLGWRAAGARSLATAAAGRGFVGYPLLSSWSVSPDSKVLRFSLHCGESLGGAGRTAPTGVKVQLPGADAEKSYSPVSLPTAQGHFDLLVKAYAPREGGGLGAYLCSLAPGEVAVMRVKGPDFGLLAGSPLTANRWADVGLVSCGTGIAPLFQVARQVLDDLGDSTRLWAVCVNRRERDILLREELGRMALEHCGRLQVLHSLTRPEVGWRGSQGRADLEMLRHALPPPGPGTLILVCGTDGFRDAVAGPVQRITTPQGKKKKCKARSGGC